MSADALAQVREALDGATPPAALADLDDAVLLALAAAIREARAQQGRALAASADASLRHVPALLRGPVRRIVGL